MIGTSMMLISPVLRYCSPPWALWRSAYVVSQRPQEIGIRLALGAQKSSVLRMVVKQGMLLAGTGILIGLVVALLVARVMTALLYGISAADPLTFLGTAVLLFLISLAASYIPALRAAAVDPMVALRYE